MKALTVLKEDKKKTKCPFNLCCMTDSTVCGLYGTKQCPKFKRKREGEGYGEADMR